MKGDHEEGKKLSRGQGKTGEVKECKRREDKRRLGRRMDVN
jgi:hypothetical protein